MGRRSAQLLLLLFASMASPGCLVPPAGNGGDLLGPYPPQVDLTQLFPSNPRTQLHTKCTIALQLAAENVIDLDSERISFRWVANNNVDNTKFLNDDDSAGGPPGPHRTRFLFEHSRDLGFDPEVEFFTGVVSLFITDAPEWLDPNPIVNPGERADLGQIDDGGGLHSVIEVRWTFEYREDLSGICE